MDEQTTIPLHTDLILADLLIEEDVRTDFPLVILFKHLEPPDKPFGIEVSLAGRGFHNSKLEDSSLILEQVGFPIRILLRGIARNGCFRLRLFFRAIIANKEAIKYSRNCA